MSSVRPGSSRARVPGARTSYDSSITFAHNAGNVINGMADEVTPRGVRRTYYHTGAGAGTGRPGEPVAAGKQLLGTPHTSTTETAPLSARGGKRVSAPPGGKAAKGFALGYDEVRYESTAQSVMAAAAASPRETVEVTPRKRDYSRPLVRPMQGVGGNTTVVLGDEKSTPRESLLAAEMRAAQRPSARKMLNASQIAGTTSEQLTQRAARVSYMPRYGPGGKDHVQLGDSKAGVETTTTARAQAATATDTQLRLAAAGAAVAGGRTDRSEGPTRAPRKSGVSRQTFSINEWSSVERGTGAAPVSARLSARRPQPVGGIPVSEKMDLSVSAGAPADAPSRHRAMRVSQPIGGPSSVKFG